MPEFVQVPSRWLVMGERSYWHLRDNPEDWFTHEAPAWYNVDKYGVTVRQPKPPHPGWH